jgi:hypothetical protein
VGLSKRPRLAPPLRGVRHARTIVRCCASRPPRFDYRWASDRVLIVTYKSHRDLLPLYMGLARGVGKYFEEPLDVSRAGPDLVRIEFLSASPKPG